MSGADKALDRRTPAEWACDVLFYPAVVGFYVVYKYPEWLLPVGSGLDAFHLFGKSPGFWYATLYTALVCGTCLWVLVSNRNRYQRSKKKEPLSRYQRGKFLSIFLAQGVGFYLLLFVRQPGGGGRRAAVGAKWVRLHTPRGATATKMEVVQHWVLGFAMLFGALLLFDGLKLFTAPSLTQAMRSTQDLVIDFLFGAVVGVGAYPILGTRVWCRYGCPMAKGMQLVGSLTRSRFAVVPNDKCRGLNLCTQACPMGIDVASYAHRDKKPIEVAFGLDTTPCIGCGGCIDVCPVGALSFAPVRGGRWAVVTKQTELVSLSLPVSRPADSRTADDKTTSSF